MARVVASNDFELWAVDLAATVFRRLVLHHPCPFGADCSRSRLHEAFFPQMGSQSSDGAFLGGGGWVCPRLVRFGMVCWWRLLFFWIAAYLGLLKTCGAQLMLARARSPQAPLASLRGGAGALGVARHVLRDPGSVWRYSAVVWDGGRAVESL